MFEFHVARQSRDRYQFDQILFRFNGNVIFANFHAARLFAQKMNQKRDLANFPERTVRASEINAMGLLDEILHLVIANYRKQKAPQVMETALQTLEASLGKERLDHALETFTNEFPPVSVYQRQLSTAEYLSGSSEGLSHRAIALEEMLMLWIANQNPALAPYLELFSDSTLNSHTAYAQVQAELYRFFEKQPHFGPENQNLIDMLRAPALASPNSLEGQLDFIRQRWGEMLGSFLYRLLSSLDFIKEENKLPFFGPGPALIPTFDALSLGSAGETENFSPDREWMPNLVLIAKNTYVWLDQLTRKYDRPIHRLDQIPDQELDDLARWGFTGLWLIGLWERSRASATVKQWCGNPEAIASAYSLFDYRIADDLGGEEAYRNLRDRAWQRGIRLASDMVPNHMGIDSPWVVEHPDWFVSLPYSPFPSYSFEGGDLSADGRVRIQIEDHYFTRNDAAVVFKRTDNHTGEVRFIYHGNDGTSMPWNDTAQLNYLNPEVREAVIQTILAVARRFPVIRFDAAMTLAKRHYQRLWYPQPGSGGDIPSRAEHGLTKEEFDAAMPIEFWREVVDRVAQEAPDTLLLAEAFWLMEGYFVRTLGMHRVYNSAFMNMLRNEDNANYRSVIKNTLEFDPEILKRYVSFMNNPDERTAVDQFGKGDKYFGICILLATLPGLPMFGHGQVEGFAEKYGMEFRRSYWDESADPYLVARHEREVFPLLHRRWMYASVENFLLYDFYSSHGSVNEDVYAYSNGAGSERSLVVYNNKFGDARGWIRTSVGYSVKEGSERRIMQKTLAQGLNIQPAPNRYLIFRDHINGLEYILPTLEVAEKGLYLELGAYKSVVLLNFRQVDDDGYGSYGRLCSYLNGRGVPNIEDALKELFLQPIQQPFRQIANPGYYHYLLQSRLSATQPALPVHLLEEAEQKMAPVLQGVADLTGYSQGQAALLSSLRADLETILSLPILEERFPLPGGRKFSAALHYLQANLMQQPERWAALLHWAFVHNLGHLMATEGAPAQTQSWMDEWQLGKLLNEAALAAGLDEEAARRSTLTLRLLISQQNWYSELNRLPVQRILETWLGEVEIQRFLGVNRYKDILWFNKESFAEFCWWMMVLALLENKPGTSSSASALVERVIGAYEIIESLLTAEQNSQYQVLRLLEALSVPAVPAKATRRKKTTA